MQLNDMMAPPPVLLPEFPEATKAREEGLGPQDVVKQCPKDSLAWAQLAEQALADGQDVTAYAYARTGYHRGLDLLRGNGWKGFGAVPWSHEPNRGVLRAISALAKAARAIGEEDEFDRCLALLQDCDQTAVKETAL
ncbi:MULTISPECIES: DUF3151 domain-containing protein [unclassified Corynebacterium]|uniref:DUF3151 domain-containing protein n=1 Tax=unclassified Corynebacterium TaxID=2624378 RepID=UPI00309534CC